MQSRIYSETKLWFYPIGFIELGGNFKKKKKAFLFVIMQTILELKNLE